MSHTNQKFEDLFKEIKIVPVMVIKNIEDAIPMAKSLSELGYKTLEVTLRTEFGLLAISEIADEMSEITVGAGTILNKGQYDAAVAAGAKFIVSPGHTDELLKAANESEIPFLPGVATPSEAMNLYDMGYSYFKLFPAEAVGGIKMLKSIMGPLPQLKFCPTGGITEKTAEEYLALSNVVCVGGSWMV